MTYLELLGWARKGIQAEQAKHREMQEKAIEGQAHDIMRFCQQRIESIEPHEETLARILIAEFAKEQQGGHFACPRCGKMAMDTKSVTRNALSRRATVYICDACGTEEALEDMLGNRMPLVAWAIAQTPELWRVE